MYYRSTARGWISCYVPLCFVGAQAYAQTLSISCRETEYSESKDRNGY